MTRSFEILIVGGGHGGAQAAIALRQRGYAGSIGVVSEEPDLPYERPPLSKEYLTGEKTFDRMLIRPESFWTERKVEFLLKSSVTRVDHSARRVTLSGGDQLHYGKLVWAAGARPRRLACPGNELAGVHAVRTRGDVERLRSELPTTGRVVIVGGGYIGLEVAAGLVGLGKQITIVEAQNRVLARVAGPSLSRFYEAEHRAHGVTILLHSTVECIDEVNGRVSGVRLAAGGMLAADMVVVGIGILPVDDVLREAGADCPDGVAVDEYGRTSLPDIFAIGDCACHVSRHAGGRRIRLESVPNATEMANVVAQAITGNPVAYDAIPWFWSNQYDLRLQSVGLSNGYDQELLRPGGRPRSFTTIYLRRGRVIGLDCVNSVKDFVQGRALIKAGTEIPPGTLTDPTVELRSMI